jgi:two-component system response regulator
MTVLLVEDDPVDAQLVADALKQEGVGRVHKAASAEEALDWLETMRPELCVFDVRLPGRSGHDLLAEMRRSEHTRLTPVVIMSSSTRREDIRRAYENGASAYLHKPSDIDEYGQIARAVRGVWLTPGRSCLPD